MKGDTRAGAQQNRIGLSQGTIGSPFDTGDSPNVIK